MPAQAGIQSLSDTSSALLKKSGFRRNDGWEIDFDSGD
jgi:hypothetical protein